MKFLIDMLLSPNLAKWLVGQGHEAIHVSQIGMGGALDTDILQRAAVEKRTVVTADLDYPRLLALAAAAQPSLILFRNGEWRDEAVIARMGELLQASARPRSRRASLSSIELVCDAADCQSNDLTECRYSPFGLPLRMS